MCSILIIVREQCTVTRTQGLKSRVKEKTGNGVDSAGNWEPQ